MHKFIGKKLKKIHAIQMVVVSSAFILLVLNGSNLVTIGFIPPPEFMMEYKQLYLAQLSKLSSQEFFLSIEFISFLIMGLLLCICLPILSPINGSLLVFACILIPFLLAFFSPTAIFLIPIEYYLLTILVLYVLNILCSYYIESNKKKTVMNIIGQYILPDLAQQIIDNPEQLKLDGESRYLTIFFSDLQNFTGISEQLNPKQLTCLLNDYFTAMTEVLYEHGATIDKYIGDSIMAFWGAPITQADHATRSVLASLKMQEKIKELTADFHKRGWPAPGMGIGINSGKVNVGNMGSKYRVAYTVIGDPVNLASRVESLTRIYRVPILITEQTKNELNDIICREIDTVTVKGKHHETRIFQPIGLKTEILQNQIQEIDKQQIALNFYYDNNLEEAKKRFQHLSQIATDPYYNAMLEKINEKLDD